MTETVSAVGLSKVEMKLLNDFANIINAREYSEQVTIKRLHLNYDEATGFKIDLQEASNIVPIEEVSPAE